MKIFQIEKACTN